jgi:hypothetical protein
MQRFVTGTIGGASLMRMAMSDVERKRAQRSRERGGLEEGEHVLRAVDDMLGPAVAETIEALGLAPEHAAAAKLAERYAKVLDRAQDPAWAMRWIGPLLLEVLAELGATPMAKTRLPKDTGPREPSALDKLRLARRQYPV